MQAAGAPPARSLLTAAEVEARAAEAARAATTAAEAVGLPRWCVERWAAFAHWRCTGTAAVGGTVARCRPASAAGMQCGALPKCLARCLPAPSPAPSTPTRREHGVAPPSPEQRWLLSPGLKLDTQVHESMPLLSGRPQLELSLTLELPSLQHLFQRWLDDREKERLSAESGRGGDNPHALRARRTAHAPWQRAAPGSPAEASGGLNEGRRWINLRSEGLKTESGVRRALCEWVDRWAGGWVG